MNPYFKQVKLLVKVIPFLKQTTCFALKGGTAINLFYNDLPRLSVDIDLVYTEVNDRETALSEITAGFEKIAARIKNNIPGSFIQYSRLSGTSHIVKIIIKADNSTVKIEISPVLRGIVYPVSIKPISPSAVDSFGYAETRVVSFEDLYAGKIIAALDRQHPRDLFDIKYFLEKHTFSKKLKTAFLVYLISHNRKIIEILNPSRLDIRQVFKSDFEGMTNVPITAKELEIIRENLIRVINESLDKEDKEFLLDFKEGSPNWDHLGIKDIDQFPAIRWKLYNLDKISESIRLEMVNELREYLS